MKRFLLVVVFILLVSAFMFGAGDKEKSSGDTGKQNITIMHWTQENDPASIAIFKEIIAEFEDENPGITVELQVSTDMDKKVATSIAAGLDIDVFGISMPTATTLMLKDLLLPLNEVVDGLGGSEIYNERGIAYYPNGDVAVIPYAAGGFVWYLRKDLLEKSNIPIPAEDELTFPKLLEIAEQLTKDGMYGVGVPAGNTSATDIMFSQFYWGSGGEYFDEDYNVTIDNPQFIEALTAYTDLLKFAPQDVGEWSWYETINGFTSERTAMAPYVGRLINNVYRDSPQLIGKVIAVQYPHSPDFMPVPYGDNDRRGIYAGTKYPEECILYMKWLHSPENIVKFLLSVPPHLLPSTQAEVDIYRTIDLDIINDNQAIITAMKNARDTSVLALK